VSHSGESGKASGADRKDGLRYAPGLDGVRALAVAAVLVYHLGTTGDSTHLLRGGYLGVDVFFVLSGYLITSLLIVEVRATGRISIKKFYIRRARRLFPAMFTLLAIVALVVIIWLPDQGRQLRGDLLAAVGYGTNWWLIVEDTSYFGTGDRPRLLTHLWSLSVEEQFYLVWPLVMILFARKRIKRPMMLVVLGLGIAASTAAGILLYDPWADPSRVYFGTDTRALAPLLGAALAVLARPWRNREKRAVGLDVAGIGALIGLAVIAAVLGDNSPVLYQGGFLGIAALGAVLVLAAGHPGTALGQVLGTGPMRWLGERSYAIYLWHWPVFVLTRPGLDVPVTGWANTVLRVGITLMLADLSFRLIERPLRRPGFFLTNPKPVHRAPEVTVPVLRTAAVIVVSTVAITTVSVQLVDAVAPAAAVPVDDGPATALNLDAAPAPSASAVPSAAPSATAKATGRPPSVAVFGDSQGMTLMANKPSDLGKYLAVTDATIEGCGVLTGRVTSRSGEKRDLAANCGGWLTKWASSATRLKPRVAFVMIGAWEMFDLTLGSGEALAFGSAPWDSHVAGAIKQGVDALLASGAKVALALTPCYRPIRASAGFWPERGEDTRSRHLNALLTAAALADPQRIATVEPPPEFCTDPKISTSKNYRWDGVHYYKPGAALYFKAVIPRLQELAR
jgi:peptidoglycan/LPS O-acetylase OafA/YrhL